MDNNVFIEFTVTDNCNCNCQYCFEGDHKKCFERNINEENHQIQLLKNTCESFDNNKYKWLTVSFWGGEPLLNLDFLYKLIDVSYKYKFVRYHLYSNGTLVDQYKKLLQNDFIKEIYSRFHVQLSYDGEPHHSIKRGNNSKFIFETADLLKEHQISFSFKATLSFDMFEYLPEIWKSYEKLYQKYGNVATYSPTLDTTYSSDDKLDQWEKALKRIIPLELDFIRKNKMPLWTWFKKESKANCMLGNSLHVHTNGNIHICHGCAYKQNNKNLIIGNTSTIDNFSSLISDKYNLNLLPTKCIKCPATYCSVCHIEQIDLDQDPYKTWISCKVNNINRCKYFKVFGLMSKILRYMYLKGF